MRIVKGPCLINIGPNPISLPRVQRTSGKNAFIVLLLNCARLRLALWKGTRAFRPLESSFFTLQQTLY